MRKSAEKDRYFEIVQIFASSAESHHRILPDALVEGHLGEYVKAFIAQMSIMFRKTFQFTYSPFSTLYIKTVADQIDPQPQVTK